MSKNKIVKKSFKYQVLDLAIIGLILGLITFSWNVVGVLLFDLKEIGLMHSLGIVLLFIISTNIYMAFNDYSDKKINSFSINSKLRTIENNAYIIASLLTGYAGMIVLKLLITYVPV